MTNKWIFNLNLNIISIIPANTMGKYLQEIKYNHESSILNK